MVELLLQSLFAGRRGLQVSEKHLFLLLELLVALLVRGTTVDRLLELGGELFDRSLELLDGIVALLQMERVMLDGIVALLQLS